MKRLLLTLSLLALGLVPTLAQEINLVPPDESLEIPRVLPVIETVTIAEEADEPILLIFGQMSDSCEIDNAVYVTKERQGAVLFVDVYDDGVPASVVPCPDKVIPMALTLPVEELLTLDVDATLPTFLAVNDHYYRINMAQIEPVGASAAVPPMTLTPLERTYASVDAITAEEDDQGLTTLRLEGILPLRLSDTPVTRVRPTSIEKTAYSVDVFQLLDDPMMCPDTYVAVQYDITVKTSVAYDPQISFTAVPRDPIADHTATPVAVTVVPVTPAADHTATPVPANGESSVRVPHIINSIETVTTASFPPHLYLMVEGYQPDGCDVPVQTTQSRSGTTVKVEIFRDLPPDTACPMMIKDYKASIILDEPFEAGTYTIDVNGVVLTVKI